ncbi:hypothetical protein [Oceanobacillus salinisoli]|uniref:hypothetical protein n=1 Tax=Oceanobacillus salinisoli TaxID=2678611 RepID=UPI0012E2945B|nr:hypothetical protein [Oceanobacillus salinisoli]
MYPQYGMQVHNPMHGDSMSHYDHGREMHDFCMRHRDHYVMFETDDGQVYDGIVLNVEADNVVILMPVGDQREEELDENEEARYGYGAGFGAPYGGYGRFPRRFRRFRRFPFPFFRIRRFFFPFFY